MTINFEPLLFLGWVAILGTILNIIGDWALLAFPIAGKEIKLEKLKEKHQKSDEFGAYIGLLAIPMWLGILFPLLNLLDGAPVWILAIIVIGCQRNREKQ